MEKYSEKFRLKYTAYQRVGDRVSKNSRRLQATIDRDDFEGVKEFITAMKIFTSSYSYVERIHITRLSDGDETWLYANGSTCH